MLMRFVGKYTNGQTSIRMGEGAVFHGREPCDVPEGDTLRRLLANPEFERVHPLDHDGDGVKGGSLAGEQATARKRGRPRKVQADG